MNPTYEELQREVAELRQSEQKLIESIRTLRDRAQAVLDDSLECFGDDKGNSYVHNEKLDALREVLP